MNASYEQECVWKSKKTRKMKQLNSSPQTESQRVVEFAKINIRTHQFEMCDPVEDLK